MVTARPVFGWVFAGRVFAGLIPRWLVPRWLADRWRSQQESQNLRRAQRLRGRITRKRLRGAPATAAGMTLLELIVACGILMILVSAALPIARIALKRQREQELHEALRDVRNAIDRYKDASDRNLIRVQVGTEGYPPDLDTLVKGVQLAGGPDRHVRFLRKIPIDPMTGNKDWGLRSVQDDADSTSWGGQDVFDIYSRSTGEAIDGTKYSDW